MGECVDRFTVLIVDGYADAAGSLAQLVKLWGFHPIIAANGAAALDAMARRMPDVVLLELRLPDTDGCDLIHHVRARMKSPGPRIVALTTCDHEADRQRLLAARIAWHLVKPVNPADLHAFLTGWSQRHD